MLSVLIIGSCKEGVTESVITNPKPDTTTHNIIWEEVNLDTLSGSINAVWGTSGENIYAGGYFYIEGSDTFFNLIRYNGNDLEWVSDGIGEIESMHGRDGTIGIAYSNGNDAGLIIDNKRIDYNDDDKIGSNYQGVWVSETNTVYYIGYTLDDDSYSDKFVFNGIKYSDGDYYNINVTPDYLDEGDYFRDMWGFTDNNIFAVTHTIHNLNSTLYHYNGDNWSRTFIWKGNVAGELAYRIKAIWGFAPDSMYFGGNALLFGSYDKYEYVDIKTEDRFWINDIYGTGKNNVFVCGNNSSLMHYSGKTWKKIEDIPGEIDNKTFNKIWANDNIIVIGGSKPFSIIPKPVLLIGRYTE